MQGFRRASVAGALPAIVMSLAILACATAANAGPTPQTITLRQGVNGYTGCSDTYLYESSENNYGDSDSIYVRYDANYYYDRVTLIRFDLSGQLPSGACIKSATLRLYQYSAHNMNAEDWLKVGAYRLMKNWTEGTGGTTGATWSYRHANRTYPWLSPAARGVDSDTDADRHHTHHVPHPYVGIPDSVVTITDGARWVEWDVTPSVQFWASTPSGNYGLVLDWWREGVWNYDDNSGTNMRSKEYSDPNYRPQLVITYVIPTSEPDVGLKLSDFQLNTWTTDPGITFSQSNNQLLCSGTTTDSIWGMNGCATTWTMNSSFEATVRTKLQQGIVGVYAGEFGFGIWEPGTSKYIRLLAVGFSEQYYEISGICAASGNGEPHDGSSYWASYWDAVYPTYPPSSPAVRFFAETPENEATAYLNWKLRYDKTNGMFYVFVNDVLVTYYSKVDFSNWKIAIVHDNVTSGIPTTVWVDFPDTTPPTPNPMTWQSQPAADSTSSISMIATTATDTQNPPCSYYFTEVTGRPGGTSSGWISNTSYTDGGLSANTQYGYKVKARDSYTVPNETANSTTIYKYTLIPAPTGVTASNVQATTVDLSATGSFPNLDQGQTGTRFATTGGEWTGSWRTNATTDTATGLTPNTQYTFRVKSRNGDAIETAWSAGTATIRTRAAQPSALAYNPVTCQSIRANWGPNGNPGGTQYFCREVTTGRNSGWITGTTWAISGLTTNTAYRFEVKARNADLVETAWTDLGFVTTKMSIGYVKKTLKPGMMVWLDEKVVTAVFDPGLGAGKILFFIQDGRGIGGQIEGMQGIGVLVEGGILPALQPGQIVMVRGTLAMNSSPYDQELIIRDAMVGLLPQLGFPYAATCTNRSSGGSDFGSQPGVVDDVTQTPVRPSYGLNMIGMLVRVGGRFNDGGRGGQGYIWIDDGSGLIGEDPPGIRVNLAPLGGVYPPPFPQYAGVTGIMRCVMVEAPGGGVYNVRELWPLSIDVLLP